MLKPEEEPEILKKDSDFRRRANKAILSAVKVKPKPKKEKTGPSLCSRLCSCCRRMKAKEPETKEKKAKKPKEKRKKPPKTKLSPALKKASSQGVEMMKKVFFPAMPHLLQDAWVFLEFGISMFAFVFGMLTLDLSDGSRVFNIVYLVLTIISIILAIIDAFLYLVQMGSCSECIKLCRLKLTKNHSEEDELAVLEESSESTGRCRMSQERKEKFNTYFELVRNIASEALLYPLLICDLFDFIVGGVFRNKTRSDQLNFSLFVVGGFYLILSVYIMRMFLIIGSLSKLLKLPSTSQSNSLQENVRLLKWFAVHILFQVLTHALLILAVSLKIRNENPNPDTQDTVFSSAFLWVSIVLGGLLPITGILSYFITNYYYMKEFSISFWIEMMKMLQAPSFTDVVFKNEDAESPSDLAEQFVKMSDLKRVRI